MIEKINITPPTTIYRTFANYNYKIDTSISEFIDNSISSFRNNDFFFRNKKKTICIIFDEYNKQIIVRDNAFGISSKDLPRALRLKSEPEDRTGLNEFGMGLKTAAFWLGNELKIITKSQVEECGHTVSLSLSQIDNGVTEIEPQPTSDYLKYKLEHGTIIIVRGVDRDISFQQMKQTIDKFASKYRRDIKNHSIEFRVYRCDKKKKLIDLVNWVNTGNKNIMPNQTWDDGDILLHKNTEVWTDEFTKDGYRTTFEFDVKYKNEPLSVSGELFIRKEGKRKEAGIDLYRRGRIIVEKCREFINEAGSFEYQRINGFMNLDNFPVSQTKDFFEWEGELFSDVFKKFNEHADIKKIIKKSQELRTKITEKTVVNSNKEFSNQLSKLGISSCIENEETKKLANELRIDYSNNDMAHKIKTETNEEVIIYSKEVMDKTPDSWFEIEPNDNNILLVKLYVNHSFFQPYNDADNESTTAVIIMMRKITLLWAYAEKESLDRQESAEEFRDRLSRIIARNNISNV